MRVALDLRDGRFRAQLGAPFLGEADVQALFARQAVEHGRWLAVQRTLVGLVGDRQAGIVADIFAQGQLAIDVVAGHGAVGAVLLDQAGGQGLEGGAVFGRPPVAQTALGVVLAARVVEGVADFMAKGDAQQAVVDRVFRFHVEEWRLQDRGRYRDRVQRRAVAGVDGLRRHRPFVAVDRFAQLGQVLLAAPRARGAHVGDQVIRLRLHAAVVAPGIGVGDLRLQGGQLELGFLLGFRAHPVELFDAILERGDEIVEHGHHAWLRFRRQIHLHVALADGVADGAIREAQRQLPLRFALRHAAQHRAVESEALLDGGAVQVRRIAFDDAPVQVALPRCQRHGGHGLGKPCHEAGLAHHGRSGFRRQAGGGKVGVPVEGRRQCRKFVEIDAVVRFDGVAHLHARPLHCRQARLDVEDLRRVFGSGLVAAHGQHGLDMLEVFGAHGLQLGVVVLQVVVAVRQAQAGLADVDRVALGILRIGCDIGGKRRGDAIALQVGEQGRQVLLVLERGDAGQVRFDGLEAGRIARLLIHEAGVQVGDLVRFAARLARVFQGGVDQAAQLALRDFAQFDVGTPDGFVGRDFRVAGPDAVDVAVEVFLRADCRVQGFQVDARDGRGRLRGLLGVQRRGRQGE